MAATPRTCTVPVAEKLQHPPREPFLIAQRSVFQGLHVRQAAPDFLVSGGLCCLESDLAACRRIHAADARPRRGVKFQCSPMSRSESCSRLEPELLPLPVAGVAMLDSQTFSVDSRAAISPASRPRPLRTASRLRWCVTSSSPRRERELIKHPLRISGPFPR